MQTKKLTFVILFLLAGFSLTQGQNNAISNLSSAPASGWMSQSNFTRSNSFVENAGQFKEIEGTTNKGILYQLEDNSMLVSFTKTGVTYLIFKQEKATEREWERFAEKNHIVSMEREHEQNEKAKYIPKNAVVEMNWIGANTDPQIVSEDATNFYHNYYSPSAADHNKVISNVKGFKKITYKNIYPFIDIEYTIHPKEGLKYSYILYPGADPSMIKMHYSGADAKLENNNIIFKTGLGNIIDHAPLTYKGEASAGKIINSTFEFLDKNTVGFKLQDLSGRITETIVIDPWQVGPSFPANGFTPNDVAVDGSGNILVYSIKPPPLFGSANQRIDKYNSAGVLQWTFDLDARAGYASLQGDVAADPAGNVYASIGLGTPPSNYYNTIKINPAGTALLWGTSTAGTGSNSMYETWTITFNCNYTNFYQSGGGRLIGGTTYYNVSVEEPVNAATGAEGAILENDSLGEIICTYYAPNALVYHMAADSNVTPDRNGALAPATTGVHNTLICINPATGSKLFRVNTSYSYIDGDEKAPGSIGINAMVSSCQYLYTTNGAKLDRWNPTTGAHYNQVAIPGGSTTAGVVNSGILTDKCGNVYVGGNGKIYVYDPLLNLINTITGFPGVVFDMAWTSAANTDIVACGGTSNSTTFLKDVAITACVLPNQVTIVPVQPTCGTLGTATATATFCGAPYTYSWSNGQTTQTATGLSAGTYTVTVSSSVSCPYSYVETQTVVINPVPGGPTVTVNTPAAICVGQSATLTATPSASGGTYLWSPGGQTTASITVSPGATTVYTVTYTLAGCSTSGTSTVTVNPPPVLTITNPSAVCAPNTVDITTAAVTAGSTGSGTLTYWTDAAATSVLASPAAVSTSGTYYIQSAVGTCKDIKPVNVTINPSPVLTITNPAAVCVPGSVNITLAAVTAGSTGGGALTYWTDAGATSALGSPNAISTSGTYYIQSTLGTCKDIKPVTVTVSPAPVLTITNPAAVCAPGTVDITAASVTAGSTGAGTLTYWTNAGATTALASPNAVTTSGTYYIQSAVGTCKDIKPVTVTINPAPVLTITNPPAFCAPGSADLTAATVTAGSTAGTFSYWSNAAGTTALPSPNAVSTSGTYYIKLTSASGCTDIKPVTVTISPAPVLTITNPAAVCAPGTVDITAAAVTAGSTGSGTLTYWTDAAASFGLASPNAVATSGTYYIQSMVGTCKDIKPVTVTINPKPTLVITNPAAVCAPGTVDITQASVTAGSTAGTLTYWTDAAGTASLASPAAVGTSGVYYIKTTTAAGCTDIKPVTVTINPKPTLVITDPAAVCAPGSVDITPAAVTAGSTAGTLTYWTNAAATTALASPNAVGTSGTYYIKVTTAAGCTDVKPVNVTISPTPVLTITNPAGVCSPTTVDITAAAITAGSTGSGVLSYWTDPAATNPLATPSAVSNSATYYILSTVGSCKDIKPVTVIINTTPALTITNPPAVCAPGSVDITQASVTAGSTGGGTLTYWTDAAATSSLSSPAAVATGGTYYIKTTTAAGCTDIKPVTVTINALPVLAITNPAAVCAPGTVDITAPAVTAGSTGGGTLTYWTDAAATAALATPASIGTSGTYYIKTTTAAGCTDTKPVTVTINPKPALLITNPAAVCAPGTVDIAAASVTAGSTGSGTLSYWTNPTATTALSTPNAVTTSGTYYIKTTTASGCTDIQPVLVTINPLPVLVITNPNAVCPPNTVNITATAVTAGSTGLGTMTYWSDAAGTVSLSSPNAIATSGTYYIKTTSAAGCSDIDPVTVIINPLPRPGIAFGPKAGCDPLCVNFVDSSSVSSGSINAWTWNFGDASSPAAGAGLTPSHCFSAGTYTVTVTDTTAAGCYATSTIPYVITVYPNPVASFSAPLSTSILSPTVQYTDESTIAAPGIISNWNWDFGDLVAGTGNTSYLPSPSHTFSDVGTYCANLIVTSTKGCKDTFDYCIVIDPEFTFFIPNAFSPNDDGINDEFYGKGDFIKTYEMLIYDRWGNMIFFTDDINKHWDGKANHGAEVAQQDVYVYVVKLTDNKDKKHKYIGTVTIVK